MQAYCLLTIKTSSFANAICLNNFLRACMLTNLLYHLRKYKETQVTACMHTWPFAQKHCMLNVYSGTQQWQYIIIPYALISSHSCGYYFTSKYAHPTWSIIWLCGQQPITSQTRSALWRLGTLPSTTEAVLHVSRVASGSESRTGIAK